MAFDISPSFISAGFELLKLLLRIFAELLTNSDLKHQQCYPWAILRAPISNSHPKWKPKSDCWFMLKHEKTLLARCTHELIEKRKLSRTPVSAVYFKCQDVILWKYDCKHPDMTQRKNLGGIWVRHSILYLDNVIDIEYRISSGHRKKLIYIYMLSVAFNSIYFVHIFE